MEGQPPDNADVVEHDRELFASAEHLGQILGSSSGMSSHLVRVHNGRTYFSIVHINDALASFCTDRLELVVRGMADAGLENLALRLVDSRGDRVPTQADLRSEEWALHSSTSSEDGQQLGGDDPGTSFEGDSNVACHETPVESGIQDNETPPQLGRNREYSFPDTLNGENCAEFFDEVEDVIVGNSNLLSNKNPKSTIVAATGRHGSPSSGQLQQTGQGIHSEEDEQINITPKPNPQKQRRNSSYETIDLTDIPDEPATRDKTNSRQISLTHRPRTYDQALVKQLRELKLMNKAVLTELLDNRFPPALDTLAKAHDQLIHLATLTNRRCYSIQIFKDLYARSPSLDLAHLTDPGLLNQLLTGYQRIELWQILKSVAHTDPGQRLWSSVHAVPRHMRSQHRQMIPQASEIQRRLFREYRSMADFRRDIDVLAKNAQFLHGRHSEITTAAQRTVAEIHRLMGEATAIGQADTRSALYHGLLRELVVDIDATPVLSPRFVLPLGQVYLTNDDAPAPPQPRPAFVLVDITTPSKALWLFASDAAGCSLVLLAEDIKLWHLSSGPNRHDGGLMDAEYPTVCRNKLTDAHRDSQIDLPAGALRFARAAKAEVSEAIKRGWGWEAVQHGQETPRKRRGAPGGVVGTPRKKPFWGWGADVEDGAEGESDELHGAPATEHRRSKKKATPRGPQRRAKPPRTV